MRELKLYQVDAFTQHAFAGNPAAVCLLPEPLDDGTLQKIAAELNLSETAFVQPVAGSSGAAAGFGTAERFGLRWFTPSMEVPLCGHATLAAAAALVLEEGNRSPTLYFDTLSGELSVSREGGGRLCMDLPAVEATAEEVPAGLGPGSEFLEVLCGGLAVEEVRYAARLRYLLVVLAGGGGGGGGGGVGAALEALRPDTQRLARLHTGGRLTGVIVTAQGDGAPYAVLSRFFGPWAGIAEDPVTGSAHSVLGPFWGARLGASALACRQCSARGGDLTVELGAGAGAARVRVAGDAVVVLRGALLLP